MGWSRFWNLQSDQLLSDIGVCRRKCSLLHEPNTETISRWCRVKTIGQLVTLLLRSSALPFQPQIFYMPQSWRPGPLKPASNMLRSQPHWNRVGRLMDNLTSSPTEFREIGKQPENQPIYYYPLHRICVSVVEHGPLTLGSSYTLQNCVMDVERFGRYSTDLRLKISKVMDAYDCC